MLLCDFWLLGFMRWPLNIQLFYLGGRRTPAWFPTFPISIPTTFWGQLSTPRYLGTPAVCSRKRFPQIDRSLDDQRQLEFMIRNWTSRMIFPTLLKNLDARTHIHMHAHIHMHTHTYTCTHIYTYTHTHMQARTHGLMSSPPPLVLVYVCRCLCMCMCVRSACVCV